MSPLIDSVCKRSKWQSNYLRCSHISTTEEMAVFERKKKEKGGGHNKEQLRLTGQPTECSAWPRHRRAP